MTLLREGMLQSCCRAGDPSYTVLHQASRGRCVTGRGAFIPVTGQWVVKIIFKTSTCYGRKITECCFKGNFTGLGCSVCPCDHSTSSLRTGNDWCCQIWGPRPPPQCCIASSKWGSLMGWWHRRWTGCILKIGWIQSPLKSTPLPLWHHFLLSPNKREFPCVLCTPAGRVLSDTCCRSRTNLKSKNAAKCMSETNNNQRARQVFNENLIIAFTFKTQSMFACFLICFYLTEGTRFIYYL